VKEVIDVLILCGHQNIANRGHTEDKGNSMVNLRHCNIQHPLEMNAEAKEFFYATE
jgi:hypothetical protein